MCCRVPGMSPPVLRQRAIQRNSAHSSGLIFQLINISTRLPFSDEINQAFKSENAYYYYYSNSTVDQRRLKLSHFCIDDLVVETVPMKN